MEKQWNGGVVNNKLFFQELKIKNLKYMDCKLIFCLDVVETFIFENVLGISKFLNVIWSDKCE